MNRLRIASLAATLFLAASAAAGRPESDRAVCLVCKLKEGATEPEAIQATRTYEGKEYGFCSKACGEAFAVDPVAYLPPVFPRPAPSLALEDLTGAPLTNQSLQGRVVLLDFWATWCAPCRKSMPELQALHDKYADRGFTVVGVSIDEGGPSKVRRYVTSRKIRYPIALDGTKNPAWDAFRVKVVPSAFLLDRQGRIVAQWTGAPPDPQALERHVEELVERSAAP